MKKISAVIVILFSIAIAAAQPTEPPYKRFPDLPPFRLLLTDSTSTFGKADLPKNRPTLIVVFSPDCEHCRQLTDSLVVSLPAMEPVTIVMASLMQLEKIRNFYAEKSLATYPSIVMGKDRDYLLPGFFDNHHLPFVAVYNRKGKLVAGYEGTVRMSRLKDDLKK